MISDNEITQNIVWLSFDPVNYKIDYYPKIIAERIEIEYKKYLVEFNNALNQQNQEEEQRNQNEYQSIYNYGNCVLGSDFFNSTVHFKNNNFYQTTPAISYGRGGFKQPGYRSVSRLNIPENKKIKIFIGQEHNEWRIVNSQDESISSIEETVPNNVIIQSNVQSTENVSVWNPEDINIDNLNDSINNKNIIVWQWCFGIKEKNGNLMRLSNKWWIPYLYEQNRQIEEAFKNNQSETIITLSFNNSKRTIFFNNQSMFAKQKDIENNKIRLVRRTIISISDLIELFKNNTKEAIDPTELTKYINENQIPHEFYCSISQDIMVDPVKTIDGFTYERNAIETWFLNSAKSPLTGLNLTSKVLVPNNEIKAQIQEFIQKTIKIDNNNYSGPNVAAESTAAAESTEISTEELNVALTDISDN